MKTEDEKTSISLYADGRPGQIWVEADEADEFELLLHRVRHAALTPQMAMALVFVLCEEQEVTLPYTLQTVLDQPAKDVKHYLQTMITSLNYTE